MATQASSNGADSLVEELGKLWIQSGLEISEVLQQELRFLKMLTRCVRKSEKVSNNSNLQLTFLEKITCCICKSEKAGTYSNLHCSVTSLYDILIQEKEKNLRIYKPLNLLEKFDSKIKEDCAVLLDSLKCISWSVEEILEFIVCLVSNLGRLSNLKAETFVNVKNQITVLIEKFSLLEILLRFIVKYCTKPQELKNFLDNHVMNWVHEAATLSLLCLLKGKDENMPQTLETMLSDLLQKVKRCGSSPEVMGMLIKLLKDSKPSRSDKLQASQTVATLVDFLLESVIDPLKEYVAILRDGLIFMITFCMDPLPEEAAGGRLFTRIDVVVNEVLSHIFSFRMDEFVKVDISLGGKVSFSSLQYKIDKVKIEIQKLINGQVSNPSDFNFPVINSMWFIDSFLENIKEMVKPCSMIGFARHQVVIIQEELLFLRAFMELQKERKGLTDLWNRIMNTVFQAEYVIASFSLVDNPIWYDMLWLSDVIQAIKLVKSEVQKHNGQIYNAKMTSTNTSSRDVIKQANPPSILQDNVVGMEDEAKKIIDKLTRGIKQLAIVSIVGMPGLGKTTMAKKVYNDPSVKYYFHRRAWCCVSQVYNCRELYFDILSDVTGQDARRSYSNNSDDELADRLRKSLKGQKYLVVIDDIWSIDAWDSIKQSFPDDDKGSRIVFTSRILDVVSQAKLNCIPHLLRTLTNEESWELFEKKLSERNSFPPNDIGEIAKNIVKNCQGVPLAVVLVAGFLAGTNIEFWKEVEKRTVSEVVGEGCMDVVELSYKYLPDHLKPCFLYFGAMPEDGVVRSKKLMNLWIAEGFIPRSDKRSVYKVAKTYLSDLISRSLVIVAKRNSSGRIKACRVHDLLHYLCLGKIKEEKFLQVVQKNGASGSSLKHPKRYDSYRLCIGSRWLDSPITDYENSFVRSIICVSNVIRHGLSEGLLRESLFENFKLLNVLDLAGTKMEVDFDGAGISFMVHLRYLSIFKLKSRYSLESIANLWNLETLIVIEWDGLIDEFLMPSTFWTMKSLRYVDLFWIRVSYIESHEFSELEHMEKLSRIVINSSDDMKELSRRLPRLREFRCEIKFPGVLEFSCFADLEKLCVSGDQQIPTFDFPNSLKKLTVMGFELPSEGISIIGKLPNLEILKLRYWSCSEREWNTGEDEFLKLKVLEVSHRVIEQWPFSDEVDDPFPSLEQLVLKFCSKLQKIPSSFGHIPTLNKIEVKWCSSAVEASAMEILQEQREMGNDGLEVFCSGNWQR